MTSTDLDAIHGLAPVVNALPGEQVPYYLASGEGRRFEVGDQLWTVIARAVDTGGSFDAAFILGPRGASTRFHSLADHQRSYYVFDGSAQFWLPGESRVLVAGDSIHVPPGVPVAYRMHSQLTRILLWSAPGGALDALLDAGTEVTRHVYGATAVQSSDGLTLGAGHDLPLVEASDAWDDTLPGGIDGYFLRAHTGDRLAWPDAINAFSARPRNTGGRYFGVTTLGAPQPYIPRHFHRQHTENFFCLSGRVWLWVNGEELLLTPGDFVHAPAGTVHSFALGAHNTRMLGLLTTGVFEPFFDVTGAPTDDLVHTEGLIDPSVLFHKLAAATDLDLVMVGPPPERTLAPQL